MKKILALIHGDEPRTIDIVLIHTVSLCFAIFFLFYSNSQNWGLSQAQAIISFILVWDITGGVIANTTISTNNFYQSKTARIRAAIEHFFQPLILTLFITQNWSFFTFLYLFMLLSSLIVVSVDNLSAKPTAISLVIIGIVLAFYVFNFNIPIYAQWFIFPFFTKLIFSSSVDHYAYCRKEDHGLQQ